MPEQAEPDPEAPTVRDRILDQLDAAEIHGLTVTAKNGETIYAVVSQSTENHGGGVIDLRTVVIDLADESVKVAANGLWVPREAAVAQDLAALVARTSNDLTGNCDPDADPLELSGALDVDVEHLLAREVGPDDYDPEQEREWGFGAGPPPEVETMVERLDEAGIGTAERFNCLQFGKKEPFNHKLVDSENLHGNFGVYATEDDALVLVDVDDPAELDAELPETFRVTSPHGPEERAHHYYAVEDVEAVRDHFGKWNFGPTWGDVRAQNQYVVGPGSQLDCCDKDGCDECATDEGGRYEIVADQPIATVEASWLIDLLDADPAVEATPDRDEDQREIIDEDRAPSELGADLEAPPDADEGDDVADEGVPEGVETVECYHCGREVPRPETTVYASGDDWEERMCAGGCDQ